jgi:NTE family protein
MNRNSRTTFLLSALLAVPLLPLPAAADQAPDAAPAHRPRIGLVLAGGGAKGGAHVGALKVLEELHVPIDCIAGTSIGALVGAGYATGQPAAEIEKFVTGIDWNTVIGGVGHHALEPAEQKRLKIDAGSKIQMGLIDGKLVAPSGLSDSSAIDDLLRAYVAHSRKVDDFDKLPIPFRAVATDMLSGDMVVLDRGDIALAMRASMAIPGAFSPVLLDPYILSDGGMVRNIPIDVARNTCADVVIVVNLVEPAPRRDKLVQAQQLVSRSMDVMFEANEKAQLATLTDRDILIDVPVGDIGTGDFERLPETIPLGEAAARKVADRLAALAVSPEQYAAWRRQVTTSQAVEARLADVRVEGLHYVNPEYLRTLTTVKSGDTVAIDAISADARHMAALDEIDSVSYRLEGDPGAATLVWLPTETSIGRAFLSPNFGIYADGGGDLKFQLSTQYVRRWMNDLGGQWRVQADLGYESALATSFYQPLDVAQRYFVEPEVSVSRTSENIFAEGDNIARVRFAGTGGKLDLGVNLSRTTQLRAGFWGEQRGIKVDIGPPGLGHEDESDLGLAASLRYDSRDAAAYATKGAAAMLQYYRSDSSFGADRDWERLEVAARRAVAIGRNLVWLSVAGGSDLNSDLPADRQFTLGGQRTLVGYQFDEIRLQRYWIADASYLWRIKDIASLRNQALYGGLGLYVAGLYDQYDLRDDIVVPGISALLGGKTPVGTISIGVAWAEHNSSIWISLGQPVGRGSMLDDPLFR